MSLRSPLLGEGPSAPWRRPEHTGLNRLPMRSPLVPFPDAGVGPLGRPAGLAVVPIARRAVARSCSSTGPRRSRPTRRRRPARTTAAGDRIDVPGVLDAPGLATAPHYTNIQMPFPGPPPAVPDDNPTGVYRTTFRVPRAWRGRRVVLHVGGAESVLFVWVNGRCGRLGHRQPAGRRVRHHPLPAGRGATSLACVVVRWSAAQLPGGPGPLVDGRPAPQVYLYGPDDPSTSPTCASTPV